MWVANAQPAQIEEFSEHGTLLQSFGEGGDEPGHLSEPDGVAVSANGEVLVGDMGNNNVLVFSETGELLGEFGSRGQGEGQFANPEGLVVSNEGTVFVADSSNERVQKWSPPPGAPADVVGPSISGEAAEGAVLDASRGTWEGAAVNYRYEWQMCNGSGEGCANIAGAYTETYTLPAGSSGNRVRLVVHASNGGGTASADSAVSGAVAAATSPSNTELPSITGTAEDGKTLQVQTGSWGGTAPFVYTYQWQSCNEAGEECANIEAATGSAYGLDNGDVGSTLRVVVTARNLGGSTSATSTASGVVEAEPARELEAPTVTGVPDSHQVLYADVGAWTGTERRFSYQWESCNPSGSECAAIEGATEPEYDLGEGDVGATVRVRVGVATRPALLTDVSAPTPQIGGASSLASVSAPVVAGTPSVGDTLNATTGSWHEGSSATYAYRWERCNESGASCAAIEDATGSSYVMQGSDVGDALRVRVTATHDDESASRASAPTQPVAAADAPAPARAPAIEGTPLSGDVLTAMPQGSFGEEATGYTYQWLRCTEANECTAIEGATGGTYTLSEADVGARLGVVATPEGWSGRAAAISAPTPAIAPQSLRSTTPPSIEGVNELGGELEANVGIWSGAGPVAYSYRWESCNGKGSECVVIENANEATYTPSSANLGATLRATVSAVGPLGSQSVATSATVATPGGEATIDQAMETAQQNDAAIQAASTTATLEGQAVAPALEEASEEIVAAKTLTGASVASEVAGEFAVNTPEGELSLKPVEVSPKAATPPTIVDGAAALFANTWPATDTFIRPAARGATEILQLRSAEAPHSFSWDAGLGAGQELEQLPSGAVAVISVHETVSSTPETGEPFTPEAGENETEPSEGEEGHGEESESEPAQEPTPPAPRSSAPPAETPSGKLTPQATQANYEAAIAAMAAAEQATSNNTLMVISPPAVVDREGRSVPAALKVIGNTITVTIHPTPEAVYPVYLELAVSAPSNKESSERDPFEYGLADDATADLANPATKSNIERLQSENSELKIKTARKTIAWDILSHSGEQKEFETWLSDVDKLKLTPYVTIRGDYDGKEPKRVGVYRTAVFNILRMFDKKVTKWGAWNEPDLPGSVFYRKHAKEAAYYWQAAQSAALEVHCHCTIVAGEFAQYETDRENIDSYENRRYAAEYREGLFEYKREAWGQHQSRKKWEKHRVPAIWGLHDYIDTINDRKTNASEFLDEFATGRKLGRPELWITEAGVELYTGGEHGKATRLVEPNDEQWEFTEQEKAAEAFLNLRTTGPRVKRVFYYTYGAPTEEEAEHDEFDSGLFEAPPENKGKSFGEARPAYCYLAYEHHDCPPTVKMLSGEGTAQVDAHGLATHVKLVATGEGAGSSEQTIPAYVIRPTVIKETKGHCEPWTLQVIAKNEGGEAKAEESYPVHCVES